MTPNRLVALVGVAAAVVTGVLIPVLNVVENDVARAIVLCVLVLAITAIIIVWLLGWQKHEAAEHPVPASRKASKTP
jgi:high-affinity Fe2+/Pb2+ permease